MLIHDSVHTYIYVHTYLSSYLLDVLTVLLGRWNLKKVRKGRTDIDFGILTPQDECDEIPPSAINYFAAAAVLEGIALAIFASVTAGGFSDEETGDIYFSHGTHTFICSYIHMLMHKLIHTRP